MQKTIKIFTVVLFAVLCVAVSSMAEDITLTTYYPAPYGVYEELQATSMAVGSATSVPAGDGDLDVGDNVNAVSYSVGGVAGYNGDLNDSTGTKIATVVNGIITAVDF